jgi:hypothetical protein
LERLNKCWDDVRWLTAFVEKIVRQVLKDPTVLDGVPLHGPILGVTDGTPGKPGEVGEVIAAQLSGGIVTGVTTTFTIITIPPGDWDVLISLGMLAATNPFNRLNFRVLRGEMQLSAPELVGDWPSGNGWVTLREPLIPVSVNVCSAQPALLTGEVGIVAETAGTTATYTCGVLARRVR